MASGRRNPDAEVGASLAEFVLGFLEHAEVYYRRPDGTPTSEAANCRAAAGPFVCLYGTTPASDFGPLALRAVREEMLSRGWCRTNVNRAVARLRHMFKWAARRDLVPASVWHGLQAVESLAAGRTSARESVRPVEAQAVEATLPVMPGPVAAMVRLQQLTGMRSGEVIAMTTERIDFSGEIWTYVPTTHKTAYRGRPSRGGSAATRGGRRSRRPTACASGTWARRSRARRRAAARGTCSSGSSRTT
jgi:integrase